MDGQAGPAGFDLAPSARVARIGGLIDDHAGTLEKTKRMPDALLDALHEQKLYRMLLPKTFGGEETDPISFMEGIEAIARHDASVAWCICQGNGCAMTAAYVDPDVAETIWGQDPRGVVAWGPGRSETFETEGGYRLNASLMFASGGRQATWLGAHSPVKNAAGDVVRGPDGAPEIRTFLMPASTIDMRDIWDVIGLRGTASDAYDLKDVFVPAAYSTVRDAARAKTYETPLYLFPSMSMFALGFGSVALGIAQGYLADFLDFAQGKTPRLAKSTVAESPVAQSETAEAAARIMAGRAFLHQEARQVWAETRQSGELAISGRARIRLASTFAIHAAKEAVDTLYDLTGSDAIFIEKPFERRFRDIHTVTQQLQGRKTHFRSVGAWMMGKDADLAIM